MRVKKVLKGKKGYVLLITLVMMIVILALSSVILVLVQSVSNYKNNAVNNFNLSVMVRQVSYDYAILSESDFIAKVGESCDMQEIDSGKIFINKNDKSIIYKISYGDGFSLFSAVQEKNGKSEDLAFIKKVGSEVVEWKKYI